MIGVIIFLSVLSLLVSFACMFKPLGDVVFSVTMGSMYHKAGEIILTIAEKNETIAIYKAEDKPFLILGPHRFDEGEIYEDFFFVNQDQVIRTATDKGGDTWFLLFNRLFVLDDMSDCERLRAPYWDDLKVDKNSSVRYDKSMDSYVYSFKINNLTVPVSFSIPAKFLTPDMLDAPNDTHKD